MTYSYSQAFLLFQRQDLANKFILEARDKKVLNFEGNPKQIIIKKVTKFPV